MIPPRKIARYAKMKEAENIRFRTWLKIHAKSYELDERFYRIHHELFDSYDCSRCRNCCKEYNGSIPTGDIQEDAEFLGMTVVEFKDRYLQDKLDEEGEGYLTKNHPCDFLQDDGECLLGDHKPESCVLYPYTDQPDRLGSMYSFLAAVSVCPVAYEICERLKEEYRFK